MEEKRPKVLALFQAVLELLDEGTDLNSIKVSDITKRAGIGKGTAYEYFKSKEEIIACALRWDVERKIRDMRGFIVNLPAFSDKIRYIFDWMEECFREKKSFPRLLRFVMRPCEVNAAFLKELLKQKPEECTPQRFLQDLCREGKEAGEIGGGVSLPAACMLIVGNVMSFVIYLESREQEAEDDFGPEKMKAFLCGGLLGQLRDSR